jgi:hypothetical protein
MAAILYSDISGLLTIFNTADRQVGGKPATFFGRSRWQAFIIKSETIDTYNR